MITESECRSAYASEAQMDTEPWKNKEMEWALDLRDSWPIHFVVYVLSEECERIF